jgi:hypothetical protein
MKKVFSVLFILYSILAFAQAQNSFADFIKLFPKTKLPVEINYPDSILNFEDLPEEFTNDSNGVGKHIVDGIKGKDSSLLIPENLVIKYLLDDSESIFYQNELDTSKYLFYPVALVFKTKEFYGLVYEKRFQIDVFTYSEKYFCTFNKEGKFISQLLIASCGYGGTGIYDDGDGDPNTYMRVPFYPIVTCSFGKNLSLIIKDNTGDEKKYALDKKGKVLEIK